MTGGLFKSIIMWFMVLTGAVRGGLTFGKMVIFNKSVTSSAPTRPTMLRFTEYLMPSNKDVLPHGPCHIKGCCNGVWLYSTARDSIINRNEKKKYDISYNVSTTSSHSTHCPTLWTYHVCYVLTSLVTWHKILVSSWRVSWEEEYFAPWVLAGETGSGFISVASLGYIPATSRVRGLCWVSMTWALFKGSYVSKKSELTDVLYSRGLRTLAVVLSEWNVRDFGAQIWLWESSMESRCGNHVHRQGTTSTLS